MRATSRSAALRAIGALGLIVFAGALAAGADHAAHRYASHLSPAVVSAVGPIGICVVVVVALGALWPLFTSLRESLATRRRAPREALPLGEQRVYTVCDGDTLWSIAARTLGSPRRWITIAELNVGARQVDGSVFDPAFLREGWRLVIPCETDRVSAANPLEPSVTSARAALGSLGAWRPDAVVRPIHAAPPPPVPTTADKAEGESSQIAAPESPPAQEPEELPAAPSLEIVTTGEAVPDDYVTSAPDTTDSTSTDDGSDIGDPEHEYKYQNDALSDSDQVHAATTGSDSEEVTIEDLITLPHDPSESEGHTETEGTIESLEDADETSTALVEDDEPLLDAMAVLTERITGVEPATDTTEVAIEEDGGDARTPDSSETEVDLREAAEPEPSEPQLDEALVDRVVEWCHSAGAERLALALRAAAQTMSQQGRMPVAARIGTQAVEVWFAPARPVTADEPARGPWAAWPGMAGWVLTEDVDLNQYAEASTIPSPAPALLPIGFDREGLVLVNASVFGTVSHAGMNAPEYGKAVRGVFSARTRAPWTDGACLLGEKSCAPGDAVIEVRTPDESADPAATASVLLGEHPEADLRVEADGRVPVLGSLVVTPMPYEPASPSKKSARLNVLGPISISGPSVGAFSATAEQLVAYVTLEGGRASLARTLDAVFDHERVSKSTSWRTRKNATEALGTTSGGRPRLRQDGKRDLVLEDVECDWEEFLHLAETDPQGALELVNGEPLEGVEAEWARPWHVDMNERIVRCALEGAQMHLGAGDISAARETVRRGLRAAPYEDNLWILLLELAATVGRGGLSEQWEEIVTVLGERKEPGVPPAIRASYQRLRSAVAV